MRWKHKNFQLVTCLFQWRDEPHDLVTLRPTVVLIADRANFQSFHKLFGPMLKVERAEVVVGVDEVDAVCFQVEVILGLETDWVVVTDKHCKIPDIVNFHPGRGPFVQDPHRKFVPPWRLTLIRSPAGVSTRQQNLHWGVSSSSGQAWGGSAHTSTVPYLSQVYRW
jgi:hypothetical protein